MAKRNLSLEEFMKLTDDEKLVRSVELSSKDLFRLRITSEGGGPEIPCNTCIYNNRDFTCKAFEQGTPKEHIMKLVDDSSIMCNKEKGIKYKKAPSKS